MNYDSEAETIIPRLKIASSAAQDVLAIVYEEFKFGSVRTQLVIKRST